MFARARVVNLKSCLQLFLYLQILDFLTTMVGLKIGCRELSPFIRELMHAGPEVGVAASKAIAVGLAAVCIRLNRGYLIGWVNYGYAALIVWNLAMLLRQPTG